MKKRKTLLSSLSMVLLSSLAFANDGPTLTELEYTGAEAKFNVPSHYNNRHNKVDYLKTDTFTYDVYAYDAPTSATPAPVNTQVDELNNCYVPASSYNKAQSYWNAFDDEGVRIPGDGDDRYLYDNYENANCIIAEFTVPEGQSLKYLDVWGRIDGGDNRNENFVVDLFNLTQDGEYNMISQSKSFSCSKRAAVYPSFVRVDLAEQGFTDNLLNYATGFRIRHTSRPTFINMAEVRLVTEPNPYAWTDKPTFLADSTTAGNLDQATDVFVHASGKSTMTLYLVPSATSVDVPSIQAASVLKFTAEPDTTYRRWTGEVEIGAYKWYALDLAGNLSAASEEVNFIADENSPVVTTEAVDAYVTTWLSMIGNERATAYLVNKSTAKTVEDIKANAFKEIGLVDDGKERYMSTYGVPASIYYIYAIDSSQNISEASPEIILKDMEPVKYEMFTINSAVGGRPHYGVGQQLCDPAYLFADPFVYDPNDPTATSPDQVFRHGSNYDPDVDTAGFFPSNVEGEAWWELNLEIPAGQTIDFIDLWGRVDAGNEGSRHKTLVFTLTDTITGESWSSQPWSDMGGKDDTPPSYGRYWFSTSDVQPQSLLYTANVLRAEQARGGEFISIFEVRVGGAEWVNFRPVADAGEDFTVESGKEGMLDGSKSYDKDSMIQTLTYSWTAAGLSLDDNTAVKPKFTAPTVNSSTTYQVMLRVNDSVENSSPAIVKVTVVPEGTPIVENEVEGFKVYPNPSNSVFNVDLSSATEVSFVTISDLTGKLLYSRNAAPNTVHSIDVSELTQGVCILYVESGDKKMVRSLIVK